MERFWNKVAKSDTCWLWQAAQDSEGYGNFGLTPEEDTAREIKGRLDAGEGPTAVARSLGVSVNITQNIARGKTWRHL